MRMMEPLRTNDRRLSALVVGFVGNCQAELLCKAFRRAVAGSRITAFYHFFDIAGPSLADAHADTAACDVLLLQDIQDVERYPLRGSISNRTKIISFPFLRFAAPWPYDDFNGIRDSFARSQDDPALHTTTYYDGMLGRLRRRVPDPRQRVAAYRRLEVEGAVDPGRVLDFEMRRLEALDERFGVVIGRFILSEFRTKQLFYTVNRPSGVVLAMVMDYILHAMGIELDGSFIQDLDELRSLQVPIHPLVARRLGIEWADHATLYDMNGDLITWEDYVRRYVERYG